MKKMMLILLVMLLTDHQNLMIASTDAKSLARKNTLFYADADKKMDNNKSKTKTEGDIYRWFQTYSEIVNLVEQKAFRSVDFSNFIQSSLKAAVSQVDAHSAFFGEKSYSSILESTSGEFSGIGVSIISKTPDDEVLVIVDVVQGGPAEAIGILAGDKILEINGEKLQGLSTDEVINKLKGKVGTAVKLKIIRNKKPKEFSITRDIIKDQTSICYNFKDQKIYYLKLNTFNEVSAQQMANLLKKANSGGCKGIILDLRKNSGGILDAAIDIADLFLEKDSLVVFTKDRKGRVVESYKTRKSPILKSRVPIFTLIDNFTASASEILAGCLQYHSKKKQGNGKLMVFLLGTPTFGKGSVQELIPIKNNCALKLTTMLYYLPGDKSIQAIGIKPDFEIKPKFFHEDEMKWINDLYGKETSLKNHISVKEVRSLEESGDKKVKTNQGEQKKDKGFWNKWFGSDRDNKEEDKSKQVKKVTDKKSQNWEEKQRENIAHDVQVQASVNMINLLDLAKRMDPKILNSRKSILAFLKKNHLTDDMPTLEKVE
jgi:carboxyl-terminal processing protease